MILGVKAFLLRVVTAIHDKQNIYLSRYIRNSKHNA